MKQLHDDLWIADAPLRFLGLEMGARMTVVRLPESRLLLISPIAAEPALVGEVQALGEIAHLVAPNRLHHLFVGEWKQAFPDATLHVAPGLETKRSDLEIDGVLTSTAEEGWAEVVDQQLMAGFDFASEVAFFHRPSATLVIHDLAFNIGEHSPPLTRTGFRMMGAYGRLSVTPLERVLVRDKKSFRSSLEQVLAWPFERIVMAHGAVIEQGGRAELERAYRWLLG